MKKSYKPKYRIGREKEVLQEQDLRKIIDGIEREREKQMFWKLLPFILLVIFATFTIIILCSGG